MNESAVIQSAFQNRPGAGLVKHTITQIQPLSRMKSLDGPRVRGISPVGKKNVYGGKDLLKSQVLSSEWNTERVREDASGNSEDGEDDELPCVIGESAGDCVIGNPVQEVEPTGQYCHPKVAETGLSLKTYAVDISKTKWRRAVGPIT